MTGMGLGMTPFLVAAICVVLHFMLGFFVAKAGLPAAWARAREEWANERYVRGSVRMFFWGTLLFWPIGLGTSIIDRSDPKRMEREMEEQSKRIKQLERELLRGG